MNYYAVSEKVLDSLISSRDRSAADALRVGSAVIARAVLAEQVTALATGQESSDEFIALIDKSAVETLRGPADVALTRMARVLKAATRPPLHLPRGWSEFH